ncbi:MAG TPA: ribonuclease H-like domain-containing protein [Candidatus Kapabacteria bacterium]|nr:ribonuclease H-like domain-containing protein [Candidatus Kapabacteria bacterium]
MLRNTFCHIPGIGLRTEQKLWEEGIRTWDDYLEMGGLALRGARGAAVTGGLERSIEALDEGDIGFFAESLPASESWRLFGEFGGRAAYLDIETTGVGYSDGITTIALYDGRDVRTYVSGENLRRFRDDIDAYEMLITYNGKCFDVPVIESYFMMSLPQAHIDLRYVLHSLGYRGGLKGCEAQLGLDRGDLAGVDGYFAVLLWHEYQRTGNPAALETLLAYNVEDTVNLERLMQLAYNMKLEETPFTDTHAVPVTRPAARNLFTADTELIESIRRTWGMPFQM